VDYVQKLGIGQKNYLFYQAKAFALVYDDTQAAADVLRNGIKRYAIWKLLTTFIEETE
jgi:hypothetical protein